MYINVVLFFSFNSYVESQYIFMECPQFDCIISDIVFLVVCPRSDGEISDTLFAEKQPQLNYK